MALGKQDTVTDDGKPSTKTMQTGKGQRPRPGVGDYLSGEAASFVRDLRPYLPQELVGGTLPHIPGTEDEAVWNAASQACGTEKIHYCYSVDEGRLWYLACPSTSLASNPDSWCPLAAALPGNSEYWDKETVYLYEQEGIASALRWDPETNRMQVFLGASRTILPRIQSMDANFVSINPELADIVPWRNRTLKTEQLARATAKMLVVSGVLTAVCAGILLIFSYVTVNMIQRNLEEVQSQTETASLQLVRDARDSMKSDMSNHMVRIQQLLDEFILVDGTLVKYEVKKGNVEWQALVPGHQVEVVLAKFPARVDNTSREKDGRIRIIGTK
ncbi:MAG: hypothetical protein ACPGRX_02670 [Bdellovibrionales bacterium]